MSVYSKQFYAGQKASSSDSAKAIVPVLIEHFKPASVVDVGCGVGTWIKEFMNNGVVDVLGIDGNWVAPEMLVVPKQHFRAADLTAPPQLGRKFSMALSVEVAEHLSEVYASAFVNYLTELAPVVAFSAAVPGQGGASHLNEQWQDYWSGLFRERNYVPLDIVRPRVWDDSRICWWYAQNLIVYVNAAERKTTPPVQGMPLNVVHPRLFQEAFQPENLSGSLIIKAIPHALKRFAKKILRR